MPENDLSLLTAAARDAGRLATKHWRNSPKSWEKENGAGPVSDADLAVNDLLRRSLTMARPDYGWLSEESPKNTERLAKDTVFIVDPIDGTRSFLAGKKTWAISIAVVHRGAPVAGVIYLPALEKLYAAQRGNGAKLNNNEISKSDRIAFDDATILATRSNLNPAFWRNGNPPLTRHFRPSLAYRMALVAEGRFDAMMTLHGTWEWDVAAGTLIAEEAGAVVSDQHGNIPKFNNPKPQICGLLAATGGIHASIMENLVSVPLRSSD